MLNKNIKVSLYIHHILYYSIFTTIHFYFTHWQICHLQHNQFFGKYSTTYKWWLWAEWRCNGESWIQTPEDCAKQHQLAYPETNSFVIIHNVLIGALALV